MGSFWNHHAQHGQNHLVGKFQDRTRQWQFLHLSMSAKKFQEVDLFILAGGDVAKFEIDEVGLETGTQGCLSRAEDGGCKKSPCFIVRF
ncbi:hypothetical protein O0I10_006718 [Lichtheimia ornata]|uniref:Uncharacterized protein n=1 Tax=Lichtheimia ornata TaxID=688661 RepID=A0AAD7Y0U1_9FUNG|nr:uncharacterized protein O0I10_006718 [Lichtheimia ornata]KAJ8657652.1 hypothetical protein O0I10_006718 [Lichtheimia ornata]